MAKLLVVKQSKFGATSESERTDEERDDPKTTLTDYSTGQVSKFAFK